VRNGAVLHETFRLTHTEPDEHEAWMSEYTLQRTRRFRALDVWAVIRTAGRAGLARAIASNIDMARLFARLIEDEPTLELVANGPLSIVRFRYAPATLLDQPLLLDRLNKALASTIQQRGNAFFTSTTFAGKEALRACFVNYMTSEPDIRAMVGEVLSAAKTLSLPLE
jgi:aromatic-L-amino-acid/L-tryptophan decarboxylase